MVQLISQPRRLFRHRYQINCDGCEQTIVGSYFNCTECPSWDYCPTCAEGRVASYPMHSFTLIDNRRQDPRFFPPTTQETIAKNDILQLRPGIPQDELLYRMPVAENEMLGTNIRYEYSTLAAGTSAIRLLALLPGSESANIQAKIVPVSLDHATPYEALSYNWGDLKSAELIWIERNQQLPVRNNLYAALRRLRLPDKPRYLWVDAICINQLNKAEKGSQVQLMSSIFQRASRVIVWLGEASDDSDLVMDSIHDRAQFDSGRTDFDQRMYNAFLKFFDRAWWRRVWCLQEIALNQADPLVMCGDRPAAWQSLSTFISNQSPVLLGYPFSPSHWQFIQTRMAYRSAHFLRTRDAVQISKIEGLLSNLLVNTLMLDSTDKRDKVYGLLGVARKEDQSAIFPDYTKSLVQVYTDTMMHCFLTTQNLNLICYNTNSGNPGYGPVPLPSWVSDWTLGSTRPVALHAAAQYDACKGSPVSLYKPDNPAFLYVDGLALTIVTDVSDPINGQLSGAGVPDKWRRTFGKLREMLRRIMMARWAEADEITDPNYLQRVARLNPDPRFSDVFWRTILADKWIDTKSQPTWLRTTSTRPAPASFAGMFEMLAYGTASVTDCPQPLTATSELLLQTFESSTTAEDFHPDVPLDERTARFADPFLQNVALTERRQLFVTAAGFMGISSNPVKVGDTLTVLDGCDMPILLRDLNESGVARFVSEAYVHGLMDGEAVTDAERYDWKKRCFKIQ